MRVVVAANRDELAEQGAIEVAAHARTAIAARGAFVFAVSGGSSPGPMFRVLATMDLPWERIHLFQVDERIAPDGHPDRNLGGLLKALGGVGATVHAMPVEADPDAAIAAYGATLQAICGSVVDLVHLGMGADGHTASLIPGDPVCDATTDVAITGVYGGWRRLTLTFPTINRARAVIWLIAGSDKAEMVGRLRAGDRSIPAGRVDVDDAVMVVDRDAL